MFHLVEPIEICSHKAQERQKDEDKLGHHFPHFVSTLPQREEEQDWNNGGAACAVCLSSTPVETTWGRHDCGDNGGIANEVVYKGHMMAAKEDRNRGEYVCVDDARVMHERSNGESQQGVHWYKVEVRCGGSSDNSPLPCGAYVQHREMACAVCRVPDARSADMKNTFVRFGSRTCTESQIYEGYIGSADANAERGGGVNFLCLHHSPTYGPFDTERDDSDNSLSYIYGAEYRSTGSLDRNGNEDAACSVCGTQNRATHTVWGRTTCPYPGWVMEFTGYAMSTRSRFGEGTSCITGAAAAAKGRRASSTGAHQGEAFPEQRGSFVQSC